MAKTFSPVRIQNPLSLQQLAKVMPGQEIFLYLYDEIYGPSLSVESTDYLNVECSKIHIDHKIYRITHTSQIHEWADYSSSMIGEIWIDGSKSIGKVGVLLESNNVQKSLVRTMVNPDCLDLRIYPHNLIEAIVFDNRFGFHDEWTYHWSPTDSNIGLEMIGRDHLCLSSWDSYYNGLEDPDYLYSRYPRGEAFNGLLTRQHHFWFRLNHRVFDFVANNNGFVHVGNLTFEGISNKFQMQHADKCEYCASVYVDCRKKNYKNIQSTLNLPVRAECHPKSKTCKPRVVVPPAKTQIVLPAIRDVDIFLVDDSEEFVGCKSLDAFRDQDKYPHWMDAEDDVQFDPLPPAYSRHPQSRWWRKWN